MNVSAAARQETFNPARASWVRSFLRQQEGILLLLVRADLVAGVLAPVARVEADRFLSWRPAGSRGGDSSGRSVKSTSSCASQTAPLCATTGTE